MNITLGRKYKCWICLEEERSLFWLRDWTRHECGCDLQAHTKCLIRWLFVTNEKVWRSYESSGYYKIDSLRELRKRVCYVVDSHKEFNEDADLAEAMQTLPAIGQTWAAFISVTEMGLRMLFRIPSESLIESDLWRGLPREAIRCPQCKRFIKKGQLGWDSGSYALRIFKLYKSSAKCIATAFIMWFTYNNPWKQFFKIGLWSMRQLFPESVLQKCLDISTTKALDIYTDTMHGIDSIAPKHAFLIVGFPLYLMNHLAPGVPFESLKGAYPWVLALSCRHSKILVKYFTIRMLFTTMLSKVAPVILGRLRKKIIGSQTYIDYKKDNGIQVEDLSCESLIKTTWADGILETTLTLCLTKYLSYFVFHHIPLLPSLLLKLDSQASPDECTCVLNFFALHIIGCVKELAKVYLAYKRSQELLELQHIVEMDDL